MLTEKQIKAFTPQDKPYVVRDDRNLYLEIHPGGGKYWRIRVWENGREIRRSLGVYPDVSLKKARQKRDEIKIQFSRGANPFVESPKETFQSVALDWFSKKVEPVREESHSKRVMGRLQKYVFPAIGNRPIAAITAPELLEFLRKIEAQGHVETAHRILQICGQIFRYAVATGLNARDLSADLKGALIPSRGNHFPTITESVEVGALMRAIDSLVDAPIVNCALRFQALTFVRPGELRLAQWSHIDFQKKEWRIPGPIMKMKRPHLVPLSRQALEVLDDIGPYTGHCQYIFPAVRSINSGDRPMSDGTMGAALRRLGYSSGQFTPHGFRSMASTNLHEMKWPEEAIELQLAHSRGNSVAAAYNFSKHLDTRRKMMQAWADWLEEIRNYAKPV